MIAAYELDGDVVTPTRHARGPWFGDQQHGASLMGLLTRLLESVPTAEPMRFTRITADLSRPVPMEPCTVAARPLRDGRRVQSVEATLSIDSTVLARAVGTRVRVAPGLVPEAAVPLPMAEDAPPPFSGEITVMDSPDGSFHDCLEVLRLDERDGCFDQTWFRLARPLIAGEEPTPLVRVASIADMISSAGFQLGEGWVSINPEISMQLEREPVGEWICTTTTVRYGTDGIGVSEAVLFDRSGRIGRSSKSLLNMPRDRA